MSSKNNFIVIGITGTNGAGKGTVVDYLKEKYKFEHFSARRLLYKIMDAKGMDRGAVGLVEGGLEHVGDAETGAHLDIVFRHRKREIPALEHIDTAEQHERGTVIKGNVPKGHGLVSHGLYSLFAWVGATQPALTSPRAWAIAASI